MITIEVKKWNIIKLKKYASSPSYKYIVLDIDVEQDFESWKITKEDWYIKILNLTRLLEWYTETSVISKRSVDELLLI